MPRPKSSRLILCNPHVTYYKPQGVPLNTLNIVEITHEEWEALRLKNVETLSQTESAEKMGTSQSTFQRILSSAYKKISLAVVKGMAIKIVK
jgi:uncharacterized protein